MNPGNPNPNVNNVGNPFPDTDDPRALPSTRVRPRSHSTSSVERRAGLPPSRSESSIFEDVDPHTIRAFSPPPPTDEPDRSASMPHPTGTAAVSDEDQVEFERALHLISARHPELLVTPITDLAPHAAPPTTLFITAPRPTITYTDRTVLGLPNPALKAAFDETRHRPLSLGRPSQIEHAPTVSTTTAVPPRNLVVIPSPPSLFPISSANPRPPVPGTTAPAKFKPKEPDMLSQTSDPIVLNQWATKMRSYLFLTGTTHDSPYAVHATATYLDGEAYSFFEQEVIRNLCLYPSLDSLLDGLRSHFLPTTWCKDLYDRFERVCQYLNEDVRSLATRLVDIHTAMPIDIPEELIVQHFLNVMDPFLSSQVQPLLRSTNTLTDVVTTAERYEETCSRGTWSTANARALLRLGLLCTASRLHRAIISLLHLIRYEAARPSPHWTTNSSSSTGSRPANSSRRDQWSSPSSNSSSRRSNDKPRRSQNNHSPAAARAPNDTRTSSSTTPSPYKLSDESLKHLQGDRRCFNCGQTGRGSRECSAECKTAVQMAEFLRTLKSVSAVSSSPPPASTSVDAEPSNLDDSPSNGDPSTSSSSSKPRLKVRLFNRILTTATADTACDLDLMTTASLARQHHFKVQRLSRPRQFDAAGGSVIKYDSFVQVFIRVKNISTLRLFFLTDTLLTPLILGTLFLNDFKGNISYKTSPPTVTFPRQRRPTSPISAPPASGPDTSSSPSHIPSTSVAPVSLSSSSPEVIHHDLPSGVPPLRDVNHHINLIDESRRYCPRVYQPSLRIRDTYSAKIRVQRSNDRWVPHTGPVDSAIPSHAVLKPSGELRWTFDACLCNDNLVRDHYPIPPQQPIGATAPLHQLAGNRSDFRWTDEHDLALAAMKTTARQAFLLVAIDTSPTAAPLHLVSDASIDGSAAWLGQGVTWESSRPVGFYSHKHSPSERNYPTHEQKVLTSLGAMRHFELALLGVHFTTYTDSRYFARFLRLQDPTPRQARWLKQFARFDFNVEHIAGITNKIADALSRLPTMLSIGPNSPPSSLDEPDLPPIDDAPQESAPSADLVTLVTRRGNANRSFTQFKYLDTARTSNARLVPTSSSPPPSASSTLLPAIDESPHPAPSGIIAPPPDVEDVVTTSVDDLSNIADSLVDPLGSTLTSTPVFPTRPPIPIPTPPSPDSPIIDSDFLATVRASYSTNVFDLPLVAHPARFPDYHLADDLVYYEPQQRDRQGRSSPLANCRLCLPSGLLTSRSLREIAISHHHQLLGHLGIRPTVEAVWSTWYWPLVRDVESFRLHDMILVFTCRLSAAIHIFPIDSSCTTEDVARLFYHHFYRLHGVPFSITSDRNVQWTSTFNTAYQSLVGSEIHLSTAYHPRTDGQTERANKTVGQILHTLVQNDPSSWARHLVTVEFSINSSTNASTGFSPFALTTGHSPFPIPALLTMFSHSDAASTFMNAHRSPCKVYNAGDFAYFDARNLTFPPSFPSKLRPRFIGPYRIVRALPNDVYELLFPPQFRLHPVINGSKLRPFLPNDDQLFPRCSFIAVHDDHFEIDTILKHPWVDGQHHFLVKFVGLPLSETRWTLESDMDAPDFIAAYQRLKLGSKTDPSTCAQPQPHPRHRLPAVVASSSLAASSSPTRRTRFAGW
ncbi:hypothetical protein JCM5296_007225 [Sporobolomyces johnsonii]